MQIRAEKCNPSLTLGGGPIEFRSENLHKHQRAKKNGNLPLVMTEQLLRPHQIHCVKELWHSVTVSMEE